MPDTNGVNSVVTKVIGGLAIAGILGVGGVYANDRVQDRDIAAARVDIDEQRAEIRIHHDAILRADGYFSAINKDMAKMAEAMQKIADK